MFIKLQLYQYHSNPETLDWSSLSSNGAAKMLISIFTNHETHPKEFTDMLYEKVTNINDVSFIISQGVSLLDIPDHVFINAISNFRYIEPVVDVMIQLHINPGHKFFKLCADRIKDNSYTALGYAHRTKRRFIEGEPAILKDPNHLNVYARLFFNGDVNVARDEMKKSVSNNSDNTDRTPSLDDIFKSFR